MSTTEKDGIGINYEVPVPYAYCGDHKWQLKRTANTKSVLDKILEAVDEYDIAFAKFTKGNMRERQRLQVYEKATKEILEAALDKFVYKKEADNPEVGPGALGRLAGEVKDFLAAGGALGVRHAQTQLDSMREHLSSITPD